MTAILQDLRHAGRLLRRNPGVTLVAVLALALGSGANSAIFSVVYAALLRPLPVHNADRLVTLVMASEKLRVNAAPPGYSTYAYFSLHGRFFDSIAAASPGTATFAREGDSTVKLWRVSAGFFRTFGIAPRWGRSFLPEEDQPGKPRVAVVADSFWRGRLNGDQHALGSVIKLDGEPYTVVGVLPAGFHIDGRPADVYAPIARSLQAEEFLPVNLYALLKRGVNIRQAQAEVDASPRRQDGSPFAWRPRLWMLRDLEVRNVRVSLWVLLGAAGLVLLIACANTATLLLARAQGRAREMATRSALGADRGRLLRQLLTESTLLSLVGGAGGVVVAMGAVRLLPRLLHERLPGLLEQTRVDGAVLGFTLAVAVLTGLLFGAAPASASMRGDLMPALRSARHSASRERRRWWRVMVIGETALALVLAIGASLLVRTFFYLRDVAPGFRADGVLTVRITPPKGRFTSRTQCNAYWQQIAEHLRAIPGVRSASFAQALPLTGDNWVGNWPVEGFPAQPRDLPPVWQYYVEADYFRTMQIPLLRGRFFGARDAEGARAVAIVSASFARRFWPGQDPLGKHVGGGETPMLEVVGEVGDVTAEEATKSAPPELYLHFRQFPAARIAAAVRTDPDAYANPLALEPAVRRAINAVDPAAPPLQFAAMQSLISDRIASNRLTAQLIAIFASLALVLAALGIYAVLSAGVAQRTHEIGLRMALGAQRSRVLSLVVGEAAALAMGGIVIGLAGAALLTRTMATLLFGVAASDPATFAASSLALLLVAIVAAAVPALRAAQVDPVASLRHE